MKSKEKKPKLHVVQPMRLVMRRNQLQIVLNRYVVSSRNRQVLKSFYSIVSSIHSSALISTSTTKFKLIGDKQKYDNKNNNLYFVILQLTLMLVLVVEVLM